MAFHPGVIIGGALLLLGFILLANLIRLLTWLGGFYGATLWGSDAQVLARYVFEMGPGWAVLLHALPFLTFFGLAARSRSKEAILGAAILTVPAYLASALWTGILAEAWRESSFRATEIGRITGAEMRHDILACHDAYNRDDMAYGTTTGRAMQNCAWMLTKEQVDTWCLRIFDAKRPFKDPAEVATCTSRVKEMAKMDAWPKSFKWKDFDKPWND